MNRVEAGIPENPICAGCGKELAEPFGWCSNCAMAYCADCGEGHYCLTECRARGCLAGFCVRTVEKGVLGPWKVPAAPRETE